VPLTTNQLNQHIVTMLMGAVRPQPAIWDTAVDADMDAFVRVLVQRLLDYVAGNAQEAEAAATLLQSLMVAAKGGAALTALDKHYINTHLQTQIVVP
jgi:hypothetical protein